MLYFESDYTEGAHPAVLARLCETNMEHVSGYGEDKFCDAAKEKIIITVIFFPVSASA